MATEVVKIVDTGGTGDYSSLAAWEADFGSCTQANYPSMSGDGDLVGADLIAVADCRCSTGNEDADPVDISGWTATDDDHYVKIWTDPDQGYRHDGRWNDTKYRLYNSSGFGTYALYIREHARIEGLQIGGVNASWRSCVNAWDYSDCNFTLSHCIIKDCNAPSYSHAAHGVQLGNHSSANIAYIYNCIVYDCYGHGIYASGGTVYLYNCTIHNCNLSNNDYRYGVIGSPIIAKNVLSYSNNHGDFGTISSDSDYNLSSDGTAPGAHSVTNATVTFVDEANDDFHLDASDTAARNAGTDLSSDPYLSFTDDIDGETRSTPWDIGADEYVSGGGVVTGTADIQASTNTNDTILAVLRRLSASVQAQTATSTPTLNLLLTAIANIQAASTTSAVTLNILRTALANILSQSTTSSALLEIIRNITADIQAQTVTPDDVELLVSGIVTAVANILAETTTSTADLSVIRELAATINAQTLASDSVELSIAGIIIAIANVLAQTISSEPVLAVTRTSQADVQTQTITSSAVLGLLYSLSASIQVATTVSDDVDLAIVKLGQAQIMVSTATAEAALTIIRLLITSIQAETTTSEALLAILRQATADIEAQTLTSAINLVTTGLGLIIDTAIESLTQTRAIESLTQARIIESLTQIRTIEEI